MTQFKVGDKVRVLHAPGVDDSVSGCPFKSVISHRAEGGNGWMVVDRSGVATWHVLDMHLEHIEEPTPRFTPYEGWEEDVRLLVLSEWGLWADGAAWRRLRAAFPPPEPAKCGKALHHVTGVPVTLRLDAAKPYLGLTCKLLWGHEGGHVVDVPEEAWR